MISKNQIKLFKSLEFKKFRDKYGMFVAEGPKLISELQPHFELVYLAEGDEADRLSFLDTPQHVFAVFKKRVEAFEPSTSLTPFNASLQLALDDIQNPGNLGTIIRLADWFGIEQIYCSRGCADIYSPKVVQATMGALAHLHIHYVDLPSFLRQLDPTIPIYGTFLDGENIYTSGLSSSGLIVMGNEGHGVSPEVEQLVTHKLLIPNYPVGRPTTESLNVAIATAIVCAEFRRRPSH